MIGPRELRLPVDSSGILTLRPENASKPETDAATMALIHNCTKLRTCVASARYTSRSSVGFQSL
jgi:hypothetical protein